MKLHSIVLVIIVLLVSNAAYAISIRETWLRDDTVGTSGIIFSDTSVNNIDLIHRTGSQVRAYYMQTGSIYSSLSSDNGITFSDEGFRVSGTHFVAYEPDGGGVRIFYVTSDAPSTLVSAYASDGFSFSTESEVRFNSPYGIVHPTIVNRPDGGCILYYDEKRSAGNVGFGKKIRSAQSDDCLSFVADAGVRIKTKSKGLPEGIDLVFSPFATYDQTNSVYKLYFTLEEGSNKKISGVYLALSTDGLKFNIQKKNPVLKQKGPGGNGSSGLRGNPQDSFILIDGDGVERMYVWESDVGYRTALLSLRAVN